MTSTKLTTWNTKTEFNESDYEMLIIRSSFTMTPSFDRGIEWQRSPFSSFVIWLAMLCKDPHNVMGLSQWSYRCWQLFTFTPLGPSSFQLVIGDLHFLSQPSTSRLVAIVSQVLAGFRPQYIRMPTEANAQEIYQQFCGMSHFPRVIGAIDGTHIPIHNPGGADAQRYIIRKGFHSLNIQVCCDATSLIRSVVARWPGSTHDAKIFHESNLKQRFENGEIPGILLGDNGYPCLHYLLTPFEPSDSSRTSLQQSTQGYSKRHRTHFRNLETTIPLSSFSSTNFPAEQLRHYHCCVCSSQHCNTASRTRLRGRIACWRDAKSTGNARPTKRHRIPQELHRNEFLKVRNISTLLK